MVNFCYDVLVGGHGHPNLARWTATPYTKEWREFDAHWPRTIPLRLLMYLDQAGIGYGIHTVDAAPTQSWYPIAISWFDFDCDYISLIPDNTKSRIKAGNIKVLFYYHEGDNPARIRSRLGKLCWANELPADCFIFVSANTAAENLDQCLYFQEHESFFRYVNRDQKFQDATGADRQYGFTMLNRTHKWWRASCVADLHHRGILDNSLWSYHTDCEIGDNPLDNPLELDLETNWRKQVTDFVARGPYKCDDLSLAEQNDHHWVNQDLYSQSYFHIVTETHFDADQSGGTFITEKTWKCIKYGQPFVIVGPAGTLAALRKSGYRTFDSVLDNSYDKIENNTKRWFAIRALLENMSKRDLGSLFAECYDDIVWNQKMFGARATRPLNILIEKLQCQI